jgi:hypothetical protein
MWFIKAINEQATIVKRELTTVKKLNYHIKQLISMFEGA